MCNKTHIIVCIIAIKPIYSRRLTERGVCVSSPGVHTGGLDGHDRGALGEDRELVVHRLGLEQVHAGHRHHTYPGTAAVVEVEVKERELMSEAGRG